MEKKDLKGETFNMNGAFTFRLFTVLFFFSCPFLSVWAESNPELLDPESRGDFGKRVKSGIYSAQDSLSRALSVPTNYIDQFFGDVKTLDEKNGTSVRFYQLYENHEGDDSINGNFGYKITLRFPNLSKKLNFSIENQPDRTDDKTPTNEGRFSTDRSTANEQTKAGLSYFLAQVNKFKFKLTGGVRVRFPLDPFLEFRVSRDIELGDEWVMRGISRSFWFLRPGVGQSFLLDFDRRINLDWVFRFSNEMTWLDEDDVLRVSHGPSLIQTLSPRRALHYSFRTFFDNRPDYKVDRHLLSVTYRQNISRAWFFYSLTPYIEWPRLGGEQSELGNDFDKIHGIVLKFELIFG